MRESTFTFTVKTSISLPNLKEFQARHVRTMLRAVVEKDLNDLAAVCSLSIILSNCYRHEDWAKTLLKQFGEGIDSLSEFRKNALKLLAEVIEKEAGKT